LFWTCQIGCIGDIMSQHLVTCMDHLKIKPHQTVLVLNSSYEPINFTNWKRAVVLVLKEKVQVLSSRVIRLLTYIKVPVNYIARSRPSRSMIYKRDRNSCQYCGATSRLTIDHVIPKSKGGDDSWENLVVACSKCNTLKSDKLLEHTKLKLTRQPRAPWSAVAFDLANCNVPEWREYSYA
jgi:5-methylcytosine-specific restriction endonuclease McrA